MAQAELTLFAHVVNANEDAISLAQAALLIAEDEYPGLDVAGYLERLERWGEEARRRFAHLARDERLGPLLAYVYGELGFHGNRDDYYDPRNSFLNEVMERRTGIPITLALVLIEIATRADVTARGVAFPGHFLVRVDEQGLARLIDPFAGASIGPVELRELHTRFTGDSSEPDARLLAPAGKRQIIARLLHNLRVLYEARDDRVRLERVNERLNIVEAAGDDRPSRGPGTRRVLN